MPMRFLKKPPMRASPLNSLLNRPSLPEPMVTWAPV